MTIWDYLVSICEYFEIIWNYLVTICPRFFMWTFRLKNTCVFNAKVHIEQKHVQLSSVWDMLCVCLCECSHKKTHVHLLSAWGLFGWGDPKRCLQVDLKWGRYSSKVNTIDVTLHYNFTLVMLNSLLCPLLGTFWKRVPWHFWKPACYMGMGGHFSQHICPEDNVVTIWN